MKIYTTFYLTILLSMSLDIFLIKNDFLFKKFFETLVTTERETFKIANITF